jgi:hypothetical protein
MNLYPSTVDLLVAINNVRQPSRWQQPLAAATGHDRAWRARHRSGHRRDPARPVRAHRYRRGGRRVRPPLLGDEFLPGVFYTTLPLPVVAGVVAAILYGVAATVWRPPQAAVPAAVVGSESPAAQ